MNIRQYYRLAASISLNESLLGLVLAVLIVFPTMMLLPKKEIIFFFIPFLFYSFLSYQRYLIHIHRSEAIKIKNIAMQGEERCLLSGKKMLLEFLPAPSLRLLIFNPEGLLIGELRDLECRKYRWFLPYFIDKLLPQAYGLFDGKNQLVTVFRLKLTGMLELSGEIAGHGVFKGQRGNSKNKWSFSVNGRRFTIHSESLYTDIKVTDEGNALLARMRTGWMPLEWEQYFKDANTPVLSFSDYTKIEEKLIVYAILTILLRYRNH